MIQKKVKPSASDLYDSAWAAIEAESEGVNEEALRQDGWKSHRDFASSGLYQQMLRNPSVERQSFRVVRSVGVRRVTFLRPKL